MDVEVNRPMPVIVAVFNAADQETVYSYTERDMTTGKHTVVLRLPVSPANGIVQVFNQAARNDQGIRISNISQEPLQQYVSEFFPSRKLADINEFVKFATEFAERAAWLSSSSQTSDRSIYTSDTGKFNIHYVDDIYLNATDPRGRILLDNGGNPIYMKDANGRPVSSMTSMRVQDATGIQEMNKKLVKEYTVLECIAIQAHEFGHRYLNRNPKDEFEADENAIKLLIALGCPRKDIATAFGKVFYRNFTKNPNPTQQDIAREAPNKKRWDKIFKYLSDLPKKNLHFVEGEMEEGYR